MTESAPTGSAQDITGLVLCGGQGRRWGGLDKPLQPLLGRPLLAWVLAALAPQVAQVLISANRNLSAYQAFTWPVLTDDPAWQGAGPLAGLVCGLTACRTPWLFVCPGDMPLLPENLIASLMQARQDRSAQALVVHDGQRLQPLLGLLHRDCLPQLLSYLKKGERSAQGFWQQLQAQILDCPQWADAFDNLNSPQQLAALAQRLRERAAQPQRPC